MNFKEKIDKNFKLKEKRDDTNGFVLVLTLSISLFIMIIYVINGDIPADIFISIVMALAFLFTVISLTFPDWFKRKSDNPENTELIQRPPSKLNPEVISSTKAAVDLDEYDEIEVSQELTEKRTMILRKKKK